MTDKCISLSAGTFNENNCNFRSKSIKSKFKCDSISQFITKYTSILYTVEDSYAVEWIELNGNVP